MGRGYTLPNINAKPRGKTMNGRNELLMSNDGDLVDAYDEMLDEVHGEVTIGHGTYSASQILSECDPIAYRVGFTDYLDMFEEDEE